MISAEEYRKKAESGKGLYKQQKAACKKAIEAAFGSDDDTIWVAPFKYPPCKKLLKKLKKLGYRNVEHFDGHEYGYNSMVLTFSARKSSKKHL